MSFWDLFRRKKKQNIEITEEQIAPVVLTDAKAIHQYVVELCEQMIETSKEMEEIRAGYDEVTAYFNDIAVIEGLQGENRDLLVDVATNVCKLNKARQDYLNAEHKITDEMFNLLDDNEAEMPRIIKRMRENETYLDAIKRDMNRLAGEKVEWSVTRQEREEERKTLRRSSFTMLYVFGFATILVAVLSFLMEWDFLPIMIIALFATLAGSYVVLRTQECTREIKKCDVNLNRAIALENRVKIKYVNIKNAVDYTRERFHIENSMELTYNYEQYIEACKEREKFKQTNEDLEYFNGRLVRVLSALKLYDSKVWVNNAIAIIDPREMVEIKHELFGRRQKLRTRLDDNRKAIDNMQAEVEKYVDTLGPNATQVRTLMSKVETITRGNIE